MVIFTQIIKKNISQRQEVKKLMGLDDWVQSEQISHSEVNKAWNSEELQEPKYSTVALNMAAPRVV